VEREPRLKEAQHLLATEYEGRGEFDRAAERYRAILAYAPEDAVALNNLAYYLAVRAGDATAALPLARRAQLASPRAPGVLDTLGWTYYLLGDLEQANRLVTMAARGAPKSADIHLHLAQILFAGGYVAPAREALDRAIELDASIADRTEARTLRGQLR
jgi:tetratricopeptide (TPR) repeat protein